MYILNVKYSKGEPLWDYMVTFNKEMLQVVEANENMILIDFMEGLLPKKLLFSQ